MPRFAFRRTFSRSLTPLVGLALVAGVLYGCAGDLDPALMGTPPAGTGGTTGTGGGNQTGGTMGTGGGGGPDCSGSNAGPALLTMYCATSGCHDAALGALSEGLNLTPDNGIGSRLLNVKSTGAGASSCGSNTTPYLKPGTNPAQGLFIDKLKPGPSCGAQMPFALPPLSSTQQQCLTQWATTLTSP